MFSSPTSVDCLACVTQLRDHCSEHLRFKVWLGLLSSKLVEAGRYISGSATAGEAFSLVYSYCLFQQVKSC